MQVCIFHHVVAPFGCSSDSLATRSCPPFGLSRNKFGHRTCKHLRAFLGEAYDNWRTSRVAKKPAPTAAPGTSKMAISAKET
jgi:hypothetical protein